MSSTSKLPLVLGLTAATVTTYWLYHCIDEYGWDGTLHYIWEGFPPQLQDYFEILDKTEQARQTEILPQLESLEEALERARLETVEDSSPRDLARVWEQHYAGNLDRTLAGLSQSLDRWASSVDGIHAKNGSGKVWENVQRRKRLLSKQLVFDMERCDALLASYQVLQE